MILSGDALLFSTLLILEYTHSCKNCLLLGARVPA